MINGCNLPRWQELKWKILILEKEFLCKRPFYKTGGGNHSEVEVAIMSLEWRQHDIMYRFRLQLKLTLVHRQRAFKVRNFTTLFLNNNQTTKWTQVQRKSSLSSSSSPPKPFSHKNEICNEAQGTVKDLTKFWEPVVKLTSTLYTGAKFLAKETTDNIGIIINPRRLVETKKIYHIIVQFKLGYPSKQPPKFSYTKASLGNWS